MNAGALSVAAQLERALSYVLHMDSLQALSVLALLIAALEQIGTLPAAPAALAVPAGRALWCGYFYLVFRKAAAGSLRLPRLHDYRDSWDTLIYPLLQALMIALWYWIPLVLCARYTIGWRDFFERLQLSPMELFRQPHLPLYLLLALETLYLPSALAAAALSRRLLPLLDPTLGTRLLWPLLHRYTRAFVALQLLLIVGFLMHTLGALVKQALPIPLAAPIVAHLMILWVPLAQARLLGAFIHAQREELAPSAASS